MAFLDTVISRCSGIMTISSNWLFGQLTVGAVLVGIICGLLTYWIVQRLRYHTPPGPFGMPLFGNYELFQDKHLPKTLMEMSKKYGPVIKIKMGPLTTYVLNTVEVALEALVKKGSDFANRALTTSYRGRVIRHALGLLTVCPPFSLNEGEVEWLVVYTVLLRVIDMSEGSKDIGFANYTPTWKLHRKIASQSLRHYLKGGRLQVAIDDSIKEMIKNVSKETEAFALNEYLDYLIFNITCALCFKQAYAFDDPEYKHFIHVQKELFADLGLGTMEDVFPIMKKIYPSKKYTQFMGRVNELLFNFINKKLQEHRKTFDAENIRDFTDSLLLAKREVEEEDDKEQLEKLTDTHLRQTIFDIFVAGIDTTRMTLQWTILCLAVHKEMQTKCQEEVDKVVGQENLPRVTDRPNLPYTEAFLMEVMRIYTVSSLGVPHSAMRDSTIHGYDAPKGTMIMVNQYAILHDPRHWDKPEEFNPDRFLDKDGKLLPKPESWLPFSAGRRNCLGENLARQELHNVLAILIHQFDISLPDGFVHSMGYENAGTNPIPTPYKVHMRRRSQLITI